MVGELLLRYLLTQVPTMKQINAWVSILLLTSLLACSRQASLDEDADDIADPDLPAEPDLPPDPPVCAAPMLDCWGECIDPMTDPEHCGGCSAGICKIIESGPGATGGCVEGDCVPSWFSCNYHLQTNSCAQICGEATPCVAGGCAGNTILWSAWGFEGGEACTDISLNWEENVVMNASCDLPLDQARAMANLPELEDAQWWASCCCDRY